MDSKLKEQLNRHGCRHAITVIEGLEETVENLRDVNHKQNVELEVVVEENGSLLHGQNELHQEIDELKNRIASLEKYRNLADRHLIICKCRKCSGLYNRGYKCFECGDTDPSQPKETDNDIAS